MVYTSEIRRKGNDIHDLITQERCLNKLYLYETIYLHLGMKCLTLSGRVSRVRDKQKKKNLPTVGFEPESHGCKSSTLATRPPKPVLIGITKMYL